MPDSLMCEFNGGYAADGCREQPLIAVILQEGNACLCIPFFEHRRQQGLNFW